MKKSINTRLSISFEDGRYHDYLMVSEIPYSKYDRLYVYGIGMMHQSSMKQRRNNRDTPASRSLLWWNISRKRTSSGR